MTAPVLAWCPTCLTHHGPTVDGKPCPPPGLCPDCEQEHCAPDCPSRREDPGDEPDD